MKSKLEKIMDTVKYTVPFAAMAFIAQEAKGQVFVNPSGVLNPFLSPDNTTQAKAYNSLNALTQTNERNSSIDATIKAGRVQTILPNPNPLWNCNYWTRLQIVNSYEEMKEGVYFEGSLMFNGYTGFDPLEIYFNGGTLADAGENGLPMFALGMSDPVTLKDGHIMNLVFSGNNVLAQADRNAIESRSGATQVQPEEENIPMNCESAIIYYPYLFKNSSHEKNFWMFKIFEFKIVNGEYILTYNINDDSRYNTTFRVITQRESDSPTINIKQGTAPDSLVCTINDENLKSAWYTVDGGAKISLMTEVLQQVTEKKVAIKMGLSYGNYTIVVGADDYFRLTSQTTIRRNIINEAPVIIVTSPVNGKTYDTENRPHTLKIPLKVSVVEKEFKSGYYSFDSGNTRVKMNQTEDRILTLPGGSDYFPDGNYTMTLYAVDKFNLETTKTVRFSVGNITGVDDVSADSEITAYPNPANGLFTLAYPSGEKSVIWLYDSSGALLKQIRDDDLGGETILDISDLRAGVIYYKVGLDPRNVSSSKSYTGKIVIKK